MMTQQPSSPRPELILQLEAAEREHAVTGITPLSHDGPKNQVRIKNQIHNVVQALAQRIGKRAVADLHTRLDQAAEEIRPLQRPASWCVLTDGTTLESLVLPNRFPERLLAGSRYYVRPLIQAAAAHGRFLLLALSQGEVRLHRLDGEHMTEVHVDALPGSLTDVVGSEVEQQALQHHTAGQAIYHAQGKGHDDRGAEVDQFLHAVDQAIQGSPDLRDQPLMLAAVEKLDALFRRVSQHRSLLDAAVRLSPGQTDAEALRLAALEAFADWRDRDLQAFLEALAEDPRNSTRDVSEVIRASLEGRVDTLVVDGDAALWGSFDPGSWTVDLHGERRPESVDLIDTALRATWRQSGHVRVIDRTRPAWPGGADAAGPPLARLRF